ncbi:hypothetical protein LCGC14_0915090, partial [marine sediment metagenome]
MSPTLSSGVRGTAVLDNESRRQRDVASALMQLEPDAGPLTTILMRIASEGADDPKVEWYEDELNPRFDKLGASLTAGAATMTVTNFVYFRVGDVVKVNNAEIVHVSATPTTTSVSIDRSAGETSARAASNGDQLHLIGSAHEEGSGKRPLLSTERANKFNYLQIFKTPFGVTLTQKGTKQFAGQDKPTEQSKKLIEHKRDIELAIMFGELGKITSGTHPKRFTRGMIKFISTNITDAAGTLTETEWEEWLRTVFRYGSRERIVFCSSKLITVVNGFSRGKLDTRTNESTYGITMTKYQNAGRNVELVEHQ